MASEITPNGTHALVRGMVSGHFTHPQWPDGGYVVSLPGGALNVDPHDLFPLDDLREVLREARDYAEAARLTEETAYTLRRTMEHIARLDALLARLGDAG